jgi:hypothetical protein
MNGSDKGMNLAVFNAERVLLTDHQMEVLRSSYQPQKLSQSHIFYNQLVYPLISLTGARGCSIMESERLHGSTTLIQKVLPAMACNPVIILFTNLGLSERNLSAPLMVA